MQDQLQNQFLVKELAVSGQVFEINSKINKFKELANIVEADLAALDSDELPAMWSESEITGVLKFDLAGTENCFPIMTGNITANIDTVCQRCLEIMKIKIQIEPKLALLELGETIDGYDEFEVWELPELKFRLNEIIEELLIMALPLSTMHNNRSDCKAFTSYKNNKVNKEFTKPFATLRAEMLKNK